MDTSRLKIFASEARDKIKEGVRFELRKKGFDDEGNVLFSPTKITNGTLFDGQILEEHFYDQWMALQDRIATKGIDYVFEETAYTWFNRLIALQILSKNHIINEPVLQYVDNENRIPYIIDEARNGRWTNIDETSKARALTIINDHTKTAELFSILISSYCRYTPIINQCFGGIAEYTEILLPSNILVEGNFISMLNDTPYISDDDYGKTELLGWLYQFYIAKKKKEVNEKTKWEADEVPAGTQIFTPNWIVKYMVENTLGRIYLDHDSNASFKDSLKYLVEPCDGERPIYEFEDLEDLKCGDLSCGSGHILNEFFDLLLLCYQEEGYDTTTAVESIFQHNLVGVDLDTRAKQLSIFSLMLKACILDKESFKDAHCMPRVLDMPKPYDATAAGCSLEDACLRFVGENNIEAAKALEGCFDLLKDANELGSVMKFNLDEPMVALLRSCFDEWEERGTDNCPSEIQVLQPGVDLILALSEKYSAICMNPPYMGRKHMDDCLSAYIDSNYSYYSADLFAVFMNLTINRLQNNAKYGMINMQSWMFLPSFLKAREEVLSSSIIDSMLHLGKNTFKEMSGEVLNNTAFIISNAESDKYRTKGVYFKLLGENTSDSKKEAFLERHHKFKTSQIRFEGVTGAPICYWLSDQILSLFGTDNLMSKWGKAYQGLATADNARFTRFWFEVSVDSIGFGMKNTNEALMSHRKWFPYNNGGKGRRWYGNQLDVVNWENDGEEIKNFKDEKGKQKSRPQNTSQYFKEVISWNMISLSGLYFRYYPHGFIFSNASNSFPCKDILGAIGYLNSKFTPKLLELISPGTNMSNGVLAKFPNMVFEEERSKIKVKECISISKSDWDSHETSWNFDSNPLIALRNQFGTDGSQSMSFKLEALMKDFKAHWEYQFNKLHQNEEELNRQFISIYGLEEELTPDVPMDEITILQQGEISIEDNRIKWHEDVLIKQFISYAMGCWMGRYRLDRPGLNIAHPNPTEEEKAAYSIYGETFEIDDDGIVPLLPSDSPFTDNAINRLEAFVRLVFGEDTFKDNWNFITNCLGKTEDYLFKPSGFWKDHKAMYQKAPIYWLFSSKGGYFKCLVYMHRMTQFTARDLRDKYLLKYIDYLRNMMLPLKAEEAVLGRDDKKKLAYYEKALKDCEEYDLLLNNVAQKYITFDLDDGVKANYAKFKDVLAAI